MDAKTSIEILRREFKTVDKSLGLKPILIDLANEIADFIEQQEQQLQDSQDRERVLRNENKRLQRETISANNALIDVSNRNQVLCKALKWYADPINEESGDVAREALEANNFDR